MWHLLKKDTFNIIFRPHLNSVVKMTSNTSFLRQYEKNEICDHVEGIRHRNEAHILKIEPSSMVLRHDSESVTWAGDFTVEVHAQKVCELCTGCTQKSVRCTSYLLRVHICIGIWYNWQLILNLALKYLKFVYVYLAATVECQWIHMHFDIALSLK